MEHTRSQQFSEPVLIPLYRTEYSLHPIPYHHPTHPPTMQIEAKAEAIINAMAASSNDASLRRAACLRSTICRRPTKVLTATSRNPVVSTVSWPGVELRLLYQPSVVTPIPACLLWGIRVSFEADAGQRAEHPTRY
jgi:hypothetical protein